MTALRDLNLGLILLCFFLSGFAALLYQTAWTREFAFVFGTSDLAVAAVLAAYMGGLALGAAAASRLASRIRRPVLVYGVLELGIALCALAVPYGIRAAGPLTAMLLGVGPTGSDPGWLAGGIRMGIAFALLLPPTALMGATLPLLARQVVQRNDQIGPRIGALYSVNTAGAIFGTVFAAFLLLPAVGLRWTVYSGAAVNGVVFAAAALVAMRTTGPVQFEAPTTGADDGDRSAIGRWILPMMTVSGAVSFGYEVLWTRLLSQILGGSVYAFSTMLASFLLGITIGSALAARLAKSRSAAIAGFVWAQLGTAALVLAAYVMADSLPALAQRIGASTVASGPRNAVPAAAVLLPFAICIGATFPFAVRIVSTGAESSSRETARVYAWNTVGSILGSIATGFFLLPMLGFDGMIKLGCLLNLMLAAAASLAGWPRRAFTTGVATVAFIALALIRLGQPWTLLRTISNGGVVAGKIDYFAVGRSSTVMLVDANTEWLLFTNGLQESVIEKPGALPNRGMTVRWLGFLGPLLHAETGNMLVIGLGGGVVVEAVPPSIARVDVIELEHEVVRANQSVGAGRMIDPLANENVNVLVNDARGALMLSDTRYEVVVSQPSHPWTAGASHLYTREFFELVRDHLASDGVFVQWIDAGLIDAELLKSIVATLGAVFEDVQVYRPHPGTLLFAASNQPLEIGASVADAIERDPAHFASYGIHVAEDVASALVLDREGSRAFSAGAPENTDDMNLLATRSVRIDERDRLDPERVSTLLESFDPLPRAARRLDRERLLRPLARRLDSLQLERLMPSLGSYERAMALGWRAEAERHETVARRYFETALSQRPSARDAQAGLVIVGGEPAADAPSEILALAEAIKASNAQDYPAIARLDASLARFGPDSPAFEEANRLRVRWRLETDDPALAAEALEMVDLGLARGGLTIDLLLRARAAAAASRPDAAWNAVTAYTNYMGNTAKERDHARQVLRVLRAIPNGRHHPAYARMVKLAG